MAKFKVYYLNNTTDKLSVMTVDASDSIEAMKKVMNEPQAASIEKIERVA